MRSKKARNRTAKHTQEPISRATAAASQAPFTDASVRRTTASDGSASSSAAIAATDAAMRAPRRTKARALNGGGVVVPGRSKGVAAVTLTPIRPLEGGQARSGQ